MTPAVLSLTILSITVILMLLFYFIYKMIMPFIAAKVGKEHMKTAGQYTLPESKLMIKVLPEFSKLKEGPDD
ncbi:MAG: hypothetical protein V4506_04975 [Bacteroidota bacterium]